MKTKPVRPLPECVEGPEAFRDADAAKRLFRKALSDRSHPQPRVINTDLAPIYSSAIPRQ
jgi:transposase-like protein